jgi:hypothetical protein
MELKRTEEDARIRAHVLEQMSDMRGGGGRGGSHEQFAALPPRSQQLGHPPAARPPPRQPAPPATRPPARARQSSAAVVEGWWVTNPVFVDGEVKGRWFRRLATDVAAKFGKNGSASVPCYRFASQKGCHTSPCAFDHSSSGAIPWRQWPRTAQLQILMLGGHTGGGPRPTREDVSTGAKLRAEAAARASPGAGNVGGRSGVPCAVGGTSRCRGSH